MQKTPDFLGSWFTTFGPLTLEPEATGLTGVYRFGTSNGRLTGRVELEMFRSFLEEELRKVSSAPGASSTRYDEAAWLLDRLVASDEFIDFLTEPAYEFIAALPKHGGARAAEGIATSQ